MKTRYPNLITIMIFLRLPHTSRFFVHLQKNLTCRLVCGEFRQVCDKKKIAVSRDKKSASVRQADVPTNDSRIDPDEKSAVRRQKIG